MSEKYVLENLKVWLDKEISVRQKENDNYTYIIDGRLASGDAVLQEMIMKAFLEGLRLCAKAIVEIEMGENK